MYMGLGSRADLNVLRNGRSSVPKVLFSRTTLMILVQYVEATSDYVRPNAVATLQSKEVYDYRSTVVFVSKYLFTCHNMLYCIICHDQNAIPPTIMRMLFRVINFSIVITV